MNNVFFHTSVGVYLGLAAFKSVALSVKFMKVRPSNYDCISPLRASAVSAYPYAPCTSPSTRGSQIAYAIPANSSIITSFAFAPLMVLSI
jgi:hypothetical protein